MLQNAIDTFGIIVSAGVGYAIVWRIGIYIVNTLLDWVTGRGSSL